MRDNDPGVAQLRRWQDAGGRWRVLARTSDAVIVALLTCDTGEEVDRLSGTGPALLAFLGDRESSEDDTTPGRMGENGAEPPSRPRNK
jgi:hypothetical protein